MVCITPKDNIRARLALLKRMHMLVLDREADVDAREKIASEREDALATQTRALKRILKEHARLKNTVPVVIE